MQTFLQDLVYGGRMLLRNPGFTIVAVLTLALGLGANTAVFSFVNTLLLRPEGIRDQDSLVMLWSLNPARNRDGYPSSAADFADWREQNQSFEGLAALSGTMRNLTGAGEPLRVSSYRVSSNFFSILGASPALGRTFLPEEEQPGNNHVAVLSYALWQRQFGGDPNIIGQPIKLDRESYTVIGVMSADLRYPAGGEIWEPLVLDLESADRGGRTLVVIGRLKPGVTLAQAQSEMTAVAGRIERQFPETNAGWGVDLRSFRGQLIGDDLKPVLTLFFLATGFILLLACVNVANLQLVRTAARRREIAIRAALGASRLRLVRQLLTESLVLCMLGGGGGVLFSLWGLDMLRARFSGVLPPLEDVGLDGKVLGFSLALSLFTVLLFGLVPALRTSRPDLHESLKESSRGSVSAWRGRGSRRLLMVSQTALATMLLIVSGLLIRTLVAFQSVEPGFDAENLLTMRVSLPEAGYTEQQAGTFYAQALERLTLTPGVVAAGAINRLPLAGSRRNPNRNMEIEGRPSPDTNDIPWARDLIASPNYFNALGLPLLRGRGFTDQDSVGTQKVAVISETAARRYWADEDPVGQRIKLAGTDYENEWISIIGIVGDVRNDDVDAPPLPQVYLPHAQHPQREMALVVRTESEPMAMVAATRNAIWAVDPDQPVFHIASMEQMFFEDIAGPHMVVELFTLFAVIALLLAAAGIYGVLSGVVSQRTQEIGIRMALGAGKRDILKLVIGQGLAMILIGVSLGLIGSLAIGRLISNFLYGVSATDPLTFIGVSLLLTTVALVACYVPARRATRVDPMVALRYE
ncbi:MAG: ABC transporter permease [Blastocatellia bacterium]|nr:ABC transporter permease [Blastocatellia bacterium]